jgi:hypothetical protein
MKKLLTTIALIGLISFQSNATDIGHRGENSSSWTTFKTVLHTYQTASGQFLNLSKEKQAEFLDAAEKIKGRLTIHDNEMAAAHTKRIDVAVNVFRFIWESKPVDTAIDSAIEIPVAPALI